MIINFVSGKTNKLYSKVINAVIVQSRQVVVFTPEFLLKYKSLIVGMYAKQHIIPANAYAMDKVSNQSFSIGLFKKYNQYARLQNLQEVIFCNLMC